MSSFSFAVDQVGSLWICGVGEGAGVGGLAGADGSKFCRGETIGRVGVGSGRGCDVAVLSALRESPESEPEGGRVVSLSIFVVVGIMGILKVSPSMSKGVIDAATALQDEGCRSTSLVSPKGALECVPAFLFFGSCETIAVRNASGGGYGC